MRLKKEIDELVQAKVITEDTAGKIRQYYEENPGSANRRLIVIFGILGALLSGMGVILIMAYNWADLSIGMKSVIAFVPLIIAQIAGFYTLGWQRDNPVWKEGSGVAIIMGVGACLFLISQIYNYPEAENSLLLMWMLLILPVPYILNSGAASIIYIVGITYYAAYLGYFVSDMPEMWTYWLLLGTILPYYIYLTRSRFYEFYTVIHHWMIPLSVVIVLGGFTGSHGIWMYFAYFSLFALYFIIGNMKPFSSYPKLQNGYYQIGQIGTAIMMIMLSFKWFWNKLPDRLHPVSEAFTVHEFWMGAGLTIAAAVLLLIGIRQNRSLKAEPFAYIFLLFIFCFYIGTISVYGYFLINFLILITGVLTIRKANKESDFAGLNFGLLIFTVLIFSRFFDSNISFLLRGLAFILAGMGFFLVNYRMYRKKIRP